MGQSKSWNEGESREAQAPQAHGWPLRVAHFFSFVPWAPCLPYLITALEREGVKVARQSEWVSSDREAQKSTEGAEPASHMAPSMICSWGGKLLKTRLLLRLALKKQHWERRGGKQATDTLGVQNPEWNLERRSSAPLMAVAVLPHHLPFQESPQPATWIKEFTDQIAPFL